MIKTVRCKVCSFSPIYQVERCEKCGGEVEETKARGMIVFKGGGFTRKSSY